LCLKAGWKRISAVKTAIHWFRRDLRLTDNTALRKAVEFGEAIVPVYIASDWQGGHRWTGSHRQQFLCDSLKALDESLRSHGGRLIVRQGAAIESLKALVRETKAEAIFFNRDPDPFGRAVEEQLAKWGREEGIRITACQDHCLHERDEVLSGSEEPYRVFTPYAKAWAKLAKTAPQNRLPVFKFLEQVGSEPLPTLATWKLPPAGDILPGGEPAAKERMKTLLEQRLGQYGAMRDLMGEDGTSRLSQDLRFGLISIRDLYAKCQSTMARWEGNQRSSAEIYVRELIWREFYMQILWHRPEVLEEEFSPKFRGLNWSRDEGCFRRWCEGHTGFPVVDAAMRQLSQTGFMHNRARMITAMFLTKDLHLDWRMGERYFMTQLVDGEIASNNGGWQWSAGTGADAAPYFRIQNPWTQTKRFDPDGKYIKRWIPELRDVSPERFGRESNSSLAKGYPAPMVNHAEARERTLEFFAAYRRAAGSQK